jgi:hypothetical protein
MLSSANYLSMASMQLGLHVERACQGALDGQANAQGVLSF